MFHNVSWIHSLLCRTPSSSSTQLIWRGRYFFWNQTNCQMLTNFHFSRFITCVTMEPSLHFKTSMWSALNMYIVFCRNTAVEQVFANVNDVKPRSCHWNKAVFYLALQDQIFSILKHDCLYSLNKVRTAKVSKPRHLRRSWTFIVLGTNNFFSIFGSPHARRHPHARTVGL